MHDKIDALARALAEHDASPRYGSLASEQTTLAVIKAARALVKAAQRNPYPKRLPAHVTVDS